MRRSALFVRSGTSFLLLALGAAAFSARQDPAWDLAPPAPPDDGRIATLDRLEESSCTECHREIAEEWSRSAHALAWVDRAYQEELKDRKKPEACHGCHVPEPLHLGELGKKPEARADGRHFGVSCEACHLGPGGAMLGPTGAAADAHPSATSPTMTGAGTTELCVSCHRTTVGPVIGIAKDFETSELRQGGASCVGCHMAVKGEVELEGGLKRPIRSHELQTPRDPSFLARAFELSARVAGGKTVVEIRNRAGHRVPGLIGREIDFVARGLDAGGKELAAGELSIDTSSYLPIGESLTIELGAAAAKVRVVGRHLDPQWKEPRPFLEVELAPGR
jgi:hypothetical protein